jgi:cation transport ATPase
MTNLDEQLIQPEPTPMRSLALRYGLIIALALFFIGMLLQFMGVVDPVEQKGTWVSSLLSLAVLFGGLYMAMQEYKKESNNSLTFGRALRFGILTSVVLGLATLVLTYLQVSFINPEMIEQLREASIVRMEERGLDDEAIDEAIPMMGFFLNPFFLAITAGLGQFIFGFVISLAAAAIHQNEKSSPNL